MSEKYTSAQICEKYEITYSEKNGSKRDFKAARPNEKWATDVTKFKIPETGKTLS